MPVVRVDPAGIEFDALAGETVMAAGQRCGFSWPTVCEGEGTCTACYVLVVDGMESLDGIGALERETLGTILGRHPGARPGTVRLACQAHVRGAITVFKRGVRQRPGGVGGG